MNDAAQSVRSGTASRRRLPRGVRPRLTLLYTVLFLAGGAVLLGITFGLVSNSLSAGTVSVRSAPSQALLRQCKAEATRQHAPAARGQAVGQGGHCVELGVREGLRRRRARRPSGPARSTR